MMMVISALLFVGGFLVSWIGGMFLYGFGQPAHSSDILVEMAESQGQKEGEFPNGKTNDSRKHRFHGAFLATNQFSLRNIVS